jgi:hypothetical protein
MVILHATLLIQTPNVSNNQSTLPILETRGKVTNNIIIEDEVATATRWEADFSFGFLIVLDQMNYLNVLEY